MNNKNQKKINILKKQMNIKSPIFKMKMIIYKKNHNQKYINKIRKIKFRNIIK